MHTGRVLIVEDRSDFQNIFIRIVSRLKYEYQVGSSLEESLDLLKRFSFHVALVDLSLNDKDTNNRDGFKVLDLIKNLNEGTESIILTAYGKPRDADKIILERYNLFGFIDKADMDTNDVENRIKKGIEKARLEIYKPGRLLTNIENIIGELSPERLIKTIRGDKTEITKINLAEIESFIKRLLVDFTPLLPSENKIEDNIFYLDNNMKTVRTRYWSKALGCGIEMWIGPYEAMRAIIQPVNEAVYIKSAGYEKRVKSIVEKMEFPDYGGAIYKLQKVEFNEFKGS